MTEPRSDAPQAATSGPAPASGSPEAESAELAALRARIDAVDRAILERLNERARLVAEIGAAKREARSAVYRAGRERDLVARLRAENPGPFPEAGLRPVFREIISATRSLEARLRVAFLGPEGTFSHLAARETFGALADFSAVPAIGDVFAAVERGAADHGVVPVENTTEGVVTATLDTLLECSLPISGEWLLRVTHALLARPDAPETPRRVASHPQPLAQCRGWLDRHLPNAERVEVASTAEAARRAARDPELAAVGSALAAELEGLEVRASGLEDRRDNTTRFLVLGGDPPPPSGSDLTTAAYTVRKGEAGALHKLLEPFSRNGVNLTSIQARPLKGTPWEYVFFLDVEGHASEAAVKTALAEAAERANSHRVLGSFPRAASPPRPGARGA